MSEPVVANRSVEALNISILLWMSRLYVFDLDIPIFCPLLKHFGNVFGAIITTYSFRFSAPLDDVVQNSRDPHRWQRQINFDRQTFPIEVINDIQQTTRAPVRELIVHEVHRPGLVDSLRNRQRLRLLTHDASPGLDAQV